MILNILVETPPVWLVFPFVGLLLMIATGPLLFPGIWHHYYKHISVALGIAVALFYILVQHNIALPLEALAEYISFISLLTILFVASGGIFIFADIESKPLTNVLFLFLAAIFTNIIGTTGASVLFIRPFMRINRYRLKPYHIVFFIFIVSNIGGLLTPIGDPPLFLGFLKGVPFSWTLIHLILQWLVAIAVLLVIFYFFERRNNILDDIDVSGHYSNKILVNGKRNFFWLGLGVALVFLDPNIFEGLPHFEFHGKKISYLRELLQLSAAFFCYRYSSKNVLKSNHFDFEAMKEVAFLFFGIFLCMIPALQSLEAYAQNHKDTLVLTPTFIYWSSGLFSSVLDNAPTYLNVLALILSNANLSLHNISDVQQFIHTDGVVLLEAVSVGAVFFGAMTYIGNGPNFMVKAIAEQAGVKMPGFGKYIWKYSLPILLPVLVLVWLLFFAI
ncbi:MAG: sodium:proton antiporter [Bacteroidota bacterium]|nr:sodium:proton antiporter [Bacteroidota bacterium]